ncbi:aryl-alcohol dehydrogenase [Mycobacterium sp. CBMA 234]|uniref:NAD(P)-dependent alcohol dehydrogenase n=1 Tax=Mycolicibacterium sp. CBMA 234 TaxID=1918495 RepID=UPI0012DCF12B|nr:NAD(P)-dependent alcohol dehydrogenase [Mycolicibacterium sp. CBMA 234]MUL63859.1 aryl-alcohol dehydrogenase [Mycolicibacterium sp. CBMA 234]
MIDVRAAVLLRPGSDPALTDVQIREPQGDEVLVRIDAVGICHTDITMAARWSEKRLPMVFGHEGAGTVVAAGPDARVDIGRQVVLTMASCSRCPSCASGKPAYCDNATRLNMTGDRADEASALRLDGQPVRGGFFGQSSFATHALANTSNVVVLPDGIEPTLAAPLGCSVQTGAGAVLNTLAAGPDDVLVVWGAGAVGLSSVMAARIAGCRTIVAVDPIAERRSLAIELGATGAVDSASETLAAEVMELTGGGATLAVDTTARADVMGTALTLLRKCGTLALVGLGAMTAELPVGLILANGLRVQGVIEGDSEPHTFIPRLAGHVIRGELPVGKLVQTYQFAHFADAWSDATAGRAIKPVLVV